MGRVGLKLSRLRVSYASYRVALAWRGRLGLKHQSSHRLAEETHPVALAWRGRLGLKQILKLQTNLPQHNPQSGSVVLVFETRGLTSVPLCEHLLI